MQGFALFRRTIDRRTWNIASWHSPHSLTWSWVLSFSFSLPRGDEGRWIGFHPYRTNHGLNWLVQLGRCSLRFQRQRPMWFREMYYCLRDKRDGLFFYEPCPACHGTGWAVPALKESET